MVKIGLIGAGRWGSKLLKAFNIVGEVTIVACKHNVSHISEQNKRIKTTLNYQDILSDPAIDAVVIATPHEELAHIAFEALEAGKHVFVEKPVAHCYSSALALMNENIIERPSRVCFPGYINSYSDIHQFLKSVFSCDPIISYESHWVKFGTFNSDILLNLASHDIYACQNFFKSNVITAYLEPTDRENYVSISLGFGRKGHASIVIDRHHPKPNKEVRILTESGSIYYWINDDLFSYNKSISRYEQILKNSDSLLNEAQWFIDCINGTRVTPSLLTAVNTLKVIDILNG